MTYRPPLIDRIVRERLLELILMDTIAMADPRRAAVAEAVIARRIPPRWYRAVMTLYDRESRDAEAGLDLRPWLRQAAAQDRLWKLKMVWRLPRIAQAGSQLTPAAAAEVAALAAAMDARYECRYLLRHRFGVTI